MARSSDLTLEQGQVDALSCQTHVQSQHVTPRALQRLPFWALSNSCWCLLLSVLLPVLASCLAVSELLLEEYCIGSRTGHSPCSTLPEKNESLTLWQAIPEMLVKDIATLASVSQTFDHLAASLCHRHVRPSSCARAHQLPSWQRAMNTGQLRVHRGLSAVCPGAVPRKRLHDGCVADSAESPRHDLSTFRDPVTRLWAGLLLLCTCTWR